MSLRLHSQPYDTVVIEASYRCYLIALLYTDRYCDYLALNKYGGIVLPVSLTALIPVVALPPPSSVSPFDICAPRRSG